MTAPVVLADWPVPPGIVAGTTTRSGSEADLPAQPQWLKQVHGDRVVVLGSADLAGGEPEADAIIGQAPGDICAVRTADCLPVLLCARDGSEIAAAHAGWRGLAKGILDRTVGTMATPPIDLLAWLGPAITQDNFEVGDEVRAAFAAAEFDVETRFVRNSRGRWQADLFGLARGSSGNDRCRRRLRRTPLYIRGSRAFLLLS